MIPTGYGHINLVADSKLEITIKDAERSIGEPESKLSIIKSTKLNVPSKFTKFLSSDEYKKRMIQFLFTKIKGD